MVLHNKIYFLVKKNYGSSKITEIDAQKKLLSFKKKFKKFKSLSFPTISSCGSNGAIVHYNAKNTNKRLKDGMLYLIDSVSIITMVQLMPREL